ncbi:MAG TPA: hypothetical protein VN775_07970 [Opitutaceae bacterium]|nr:hypothetical protein [Opitutaceae bacterium]
MKSPLIALFCLWVSPLPASAPGDAPAGSLPDGDRWSLGDSGDIRWIVARDGRLPHGDHVEMSGLRASMVVTYLVDADRRIHVRDLAVWPGFIVKYDYRSYLMRSFEGDDAPAFSLDGRPFAVPAVERVTFDGVLHVAYEPSGVRVRRSLFPSPDKPAVFDLWEVTNPSGGPVTIEIGDVRQSERVRGAEADYAIETRIRGAKAVLGAGESAAFWVEHGAGVAGAGAAAGDGAAELRARTGFVAMIGGRLALHTPDPVLDREFGFAKVRAAESIFATRSGLVHSPGGIRYYGGVWANDQVEYAHPFFAYLGYGLADEAAVNGYRLYMPYMTPEFCRIPYSFEMDGAHPIASVDRGDAAMYACGASLYALARGDEPVARALWPAIQWCLEYCRRMTTAEGVVASDTDEMEGRLPTGRANLSTSALAYGGLVSAARLAGEMGEPEEVGRRYAERAAALRAAIERYFGADIEGYRTYRYYAGCARLRHWICLPLAVGIDERREGTTRALLERLWTPNGLTVEDGRDSFWDRATLYALRGLLISGATEAGVSRLRAYTERRLLGEHTPYPVEAYPEGDQAHLSAESALYCRVIIEGLFGIRPVGLRQFDCTPRLPAGWDRMSLDDVRAFGSRFSVEVRADPPGGMRLCVTRDGKALLSRAGRSGDTFRVRL